MTEKLGSNSDRPLFSLILPAPAGGEDSGEVAAEMDNHHSRKTV